MRSVTNRLRWPKSINHRSQNCGAGRCHQLGLCMLLINRRIPQQIRCGRRRHRKYTVLAMNEAAADIDREHRNRSIPKRVETNRRTDSVDNRVDRADFVKLNIFRRDVVNFAFRNRQLRKNVRSRSVSHSPGSSLLANHFRIWEALR